jgi:hypothetical protein
MQNYLVDPKVLIDQCEDQIRKSKIEAAEAECG